MKPDQARNLIKSTFTRAFDKTSFRTFAINVLNRFDETKASQMVVPDAFKPHVRSCLRLGTYKSPQGELAEVLIVNTTENHKIERARTGLRDFVAHKLKREENYKEAGLVAFVSPDSRRWRFSYIRMDYESKRDPRTGKIVPEERLTPARRFSYLVGEGESSHTAQSRFLGLLQDTSTDPTLADIEEAFSVEAVTKEFFTKYAELFEQINKELTKLVEKDKAIRDEFKSKEVNTVDFAKKLMGQIVFLYFIQKKGWLGVAKGKDWGTGPHDFLRRLANGEHGKYNNFFNNILEPLFYDTLATDRGHEAWENRFKCRIPFLNGGLFEPLGGYNWKKTDIILPNKLFTNNEFFEEGITGTGVLDVFDRYNFTVNESEPLEKEVAIDPEMLGKVFENLIEENRRKGLGAYYTPREIIHYMCQESLVNYLDTGVNKNKELVPRADIETFVQLGEQISHYEAVETDYKVKMPKSIQGQAKLIDEKLAEITVCDPAVGSGAFPVGMMTEIVRARRALTPYFNDVHERTAYHFKRHAIQNCLYGVDIDPSAVEIAKLRLWLSLVVDEEETKQIKPLPNLDYKIMQGNSLVEEYEGIKLFDEGLIKAAPVELIEQIKHIKNKISSLQKLYIDLHSAGKLSKVKKADLDEQMKQQQSLLKQIQKGKDNDSENADLFDALSATKKNWEELKKKHQEFFSSSDKTQKNDLRKRIANLELELIKATLEEQGKKSSIAKIEEHIRANTRPFFLWKLNFGEIFLSNSEPGGGFDVVIANPPYVSALEFTARYSKADRDILKKSYKVAKGAYDLYVIFIERGLKLLTSGGVLTFINPNKYLSAKYAETLREYILDNATLVKLLDVSGIMVFEQVSVYPVVSIMLNCVNVVDHARLVLPKVRKTQIFDPRNFIESQVSAIVLRSLPEYIWGFLLSPNIELLLKLTNGASRLSEVASINASSTAGEADEYGRFIQNKLLNDSLKLVNTGTIDKYYSLWGVAELTHGGQKFLTPYLPLGKAHVSSRRRQLYNSPKLIFAKMARLCEAFFDDEAEYASLNTNCLYDVRDDTSIGFMAGYCNSKLFMFFYDQFFGSLRMSGGYFQFQSPQLRVLPFKKPSELIDKKISGLVHKIIKSKKRDPDVDTSVLECEVDKLVYELYGLTKEEIAIVEGTVK